jgi:nucleotide-binding universal stress UspA family protein
MPREKKAGQGMSILLATDGSPDSRAAVDFVRTVEFPASSHLTILHVVKKHLYETEQALTADSKHEDELAKLGEELLQIRGREGAKLLGNTRKALSSQDLTIQERLVYGNAAPEILKAARYIKADLIVMGSQGSTGVKRIFLGSVSNKVVHSAGCSVAVIRNIKKK